MSEESSPCQTHSLLLPRVTGGLLIWKTGECSDDGRLEINACSPLQLVFRRIVHGEIGTKLRHHTGFEALRAIQRRIVCRIDDEAGNDYADNSFHSVHAKQRKNCIVEC